MAAGNAAPEGHIRKRQYQPSISSFFAHRDAPSSSAPERARSPMSPPLPADTQASLLSVGMRVRKSVPEGYKTHKTMGVEEFPFPNTAPVKEVERTFLSRPTKELMPFCGLDKTGNWGAQKTPTSSAPAAYYRAAEQGDDIPDMSISQSTWQSSQASFGMNEAAFDANSRKRTYEEEVEEDLDAYFNVIDSEPAPAPVPRPMAKMKQPARREASGHRKGAASVGGNDFEDAMFLVPPEGMDVDQL